MFSYNGKTLKTWNIYSGCKYGCTYCWARSLILNRMKDTTKYKDCKFEPTYHERDYNKSFKPDDFVFVAPMGDIASCPKDKIELIINKVKEYSNTKFLFCTKNPGIYNHFPELWNIYYGTTIETNRSYSSIISKAPSVYGRYAIMTCLEDAPRKFISIEPIMDFDLDIFTEWMENIKPEIVEVGADNYNNRLIEPSSDKVKSLIANIKELGITVVEKEGLDRLLKENR